MHVCDTLRVQRECALDDSGENVFCTSNLISNAVSNEFLSRNCV